MQDYSLYGRRGPEPKHVRQGNARESVRKNRDTSERQGTGYEGIEGGTGIGAMHAFTGRRADYLPIRNMSDRELLHHLDKANTPGVAVLAGSNFDYTEGMKSGIEPRHAYTVVGTRFSRSRNEYMVEVRDPHGGTQYPVLGTHGETVELSLRRFRATFETVTAPMP